MFFVCSGCVRPIGLSSADRRGGILRQAQDERERGTGSGERGTGNEELEAGSWELGAGARRTGHSIRQPPSIPNQSFNFTFVAINTPPTNAPSACTFMPLKVATVRPPK